MMKLPDAKLPDAKLPDAKLPETLGGKSASRTAPTATATGMKEKDAPTKEKKRRRCTSHAVSPWWTEKRVENGLRRFQRDLFAEREIDLPCSYHAYARLIPDAEKHLPPRQRTFPPPDAVLRHFESFEQAWWKLGYTVVPARNSPQTYELTPEIEETLRQLYSVPFKSKKRLDLGIGGVKETAKRMGYPGHVFVKFAQRLGLTRKNYTPWSMAEIALLDDQGYRSPESLVAIFKRAGFKRTEADIRGMRARRRSHKAAPYFSLNAVALLFGVDGHKVAEWVAEGWLPVRFKQTRKAQTGKGDTRLADKDGIYEFIVAHPADFELSKVDQLWFLHIVTRGAVEFIKSDRTGERVIGQVLAEPVSPRQKRSRRS